MSRREKILLVELEEHNWLKVGCRTMVAMVRGLVSGYFHVEFGGREYLAVGLRKGKMIMFFLTVTPRYRVLKDTSLSRAWYRYKKEKRL